MADSQKYGRTEQLLDKDNIVDGGAFYPSTSSHKMVSSNNTAILLIPCKPNTTYTITRQNSITKRFIMCFLASNEIYADMPVYGDVGSSTALILTSTSTAESQYLCLYYAKTGGSDSSTPEEIQNQLAEVMINEGPIAKPYQPYLKWQHSLRKLTTATEAVENPLYSDGTAISTYTIKGNTVQNGAPTPSNPVDVNGVGVRTENLLSLADVSTQTSNGIEFSVNAQKGTVTINGTAILNQDTAFNIPIDSTLIGDFYVSGCPDGGSMSTYDIYVWDVTSRARCRKWDGTTGMESFLNASQSEEIQILQGHDNILRIRVRYGIQFDNLEFKPMIRIPTASSAFEPYGYKIPISSGGVTTNVYLSEPLYKIGDYADTIAADGTVTRNIASVDLSSYTFTYNTQTTVWSCNTLPNIKYSSSGSTLGLGVAEKYVNHTASGLYSAVNNFAIDTNTVGVNTGSDSIEPSGRLYYVLATPTTETVTAPSIPTTEGANSITVDTTVQPSEFTATWTGWHNASVKEWDGSEWQ